MDSEVQGRLNMMRLHLDQIAKQTQRLAEEALITESLAKSCAEIVGVMCTLAGVENDLVDRWKKAGPLERFEHVKNIQEQLLTLQSKPAGSA